MNGTDDKENQKLHSAEEVKNEQKKKTDEAPKKPGEETSELRMQETDPEEEEVQA